MKKNLFKLTFLFLIGLLFIITGCNDNPVDLVDPIDPIDPVVNPVLQDVVKTINNNELSLEYQYDLTEYNETKILNETNCSELYKDYTKFHTEDLNEVDWLCLYVLKYENNNEDYEYELYRDNTYSIKSYKGTSLNIELPSYYQNKRITRIETKAFYRSNIETIVISDYINKIGDQAFSLSSLKTFDTSVKNTNDITFCDECFKYCSLLEKVTLPVNQKQISMGNFAYDNNLKELVNTSSIEEVLDDAFFLCSSLNTFDFISNLKSIGARSFYSCNGIINVKLSNQITDIPEQAFFECKNIESVVLGNQIISLQSEAFNGCSKIISVDFPDGLESIGTGCFSACESLIKVILPNGLKEISSAAFQNCYGILSVKINEGLTDIGSCCFINCKNMTELIISSTVTHFGLDCFQNCSSLKEVVLPDNMRDVYDSSFSGCTSLEKINIPEKVILIGGSAFNNCNLKEVVIPRACVNIMNNAFKGNKNLQKITINYIGNRSNDATLFKDIFGGSVPTSLKEVVITDLCTEIKDNAFNNCGNIKTLTFTNNVTKIGINALTGLSGIDNIYFDGTETELSKIQIDSSNSSILSKIICLK